MIQDMKTTLIRLFTVMMLIMVSMVAQADVKVLFGEDGKELEPGKDGTITLSQKEVTGGTITITQEKPTDGKVRVNFNVAPASGYTYTDGNITLVAFFPLSSTRADSPAEDITVHSTLTLTPKDKSQTDTSKPRDYYVDIDEGLGLWVQKAKFLENDSPTKTNRGGVPEITEDDDGNGIIAESEKKYYLLQNVGNTGVKAFYAMPYSNSNETKISTTNVPNSDMRFYFMNVDDEEGYYYIIHCSGKYLYAKNIYNDGALLKESATKPTDGRYMFSIEQNGEGYYIINKTEGSTAPLAKRGGNAQVKDGYYLKWNTYTPRDNFFLWNFIPISETSPVVWTPLFALSTEDSRSYYKIQHREKATFYISRNTSTDKVNTSAEADNNEKVWYFEEVPVGDNGSDKYITYYYIVHALTGKYMCFDGDPAKYTTKQSDAASIQTKTEANEQKCQFIVTRSGENENNAVFYNIIPKALKDYYWNHQCIALSDNNSPEGKNVFTKTDREDNKQARWIFGSPIEYTNVCVTPTIYCSNTGVVTIESTTEESTIYYTTDGTRPTTSSNPYNGTFTISATTTIKAIATKDGVTQSLVATKTITKVATPSIINNGTQIVISCNTDGATKYYSTDDGANYTEYTGPLTAVDFEGQTITAIAKKDGCINSLENTLDVTTSCIMPTITLDHQTGEVTIASTTEGSVIHYTIGSTTPESPTASSELFTTLTLTEGKTIKAIATLDDGSNASAVATVTFSQVATPSISKESNAIAIGCTTDVAEIRYTVGTSATDVPSDPVYGSTSYTTSLTENVSNRPIKARAFKDGMVPSAVYATTDNIKLKCNTPVITKGVGGEKIFYIGCDFPAGTTIYYTKDDDIDPSSPTTGTLLYESTGVSFDDYGFTAYAIATHTDYQNSDVASKLILQDLDGEGTALNPYVINEGEYALFVAKAGDEPDKYYQLRTNISLTTTADKALKITTPFTGTLEGVAQLDSETGELTYPEISGLTHALFDKIDGGTVKNIIFDVAISNGTNVGAVASEMTGTSAKKACIYNCGVFGSVGGSGYVGGLVGLLGQEGGTDADNNKCYARVINCFSFASVGSGSVKGGIVGYNCYASKSGDIRSMVMNCMFYGTGSGIYPIYGGTEISNEDDSKLNNYNYFSFDKLPTANITAYNRALAAEERYLNRFEFYRYMLNGNRELAAAYALGTDEKVKAEKTTHEMAKWVLDRSIAEYPILKPQGTYPSVVNYDPQYTYYSESEPKKLRTAIGSDEENRNKGRNLGELSVTIDGLGSNAPSGAKLLDENGAVITGDNPQRELTLQRTDKDYDDFNFNYDKVQLPYYNDYGTGNYTANKVVTGWIITEMTGGSLGSFSTSYDAPGYNFADRSTYAKDIYNATTNPRVFSQGAYFDVPDNVSAIKIKPYWGNAAYLSDEYYDCYGYETGNGLTDFGTRYTIGSDNSICGSSQTVYKTINDALGDSHLTGSKVYDNAVVLVGNHHLQGTKDLANTKPFTIMSIDFDKDNEPDYSLIVSSGKNEKIPSIRFDFINVPGVAMAHKKTSTTAMGILGNSTPSGWFEVTNTAVIRFSQFEYDWGSKTAKSPLILLGGVVEQFVSTNLNATNHTEYIHVGSNVWFKLFNNGCHMDKTHATPHRPISVTGGEYEKFYLSGYFRPDATPYTTADGGQNAECYISGGKFGEVAGAGQEQIAGDVKWMIDQADIDDFYGGGINDNKPILGDVEVTIKNSHVGQYCGGPKFGNMNDTTTPKKKVKTKATNCTFVTYFGAGFGGTAYVRATAFNKYQTLNYNWNSSSENDDITPKFTKSGALHERGKYDSDKGISVNYEYENFEGSTVNTVGRLYVNYASLSLAQTNDVTSELTNCIIKGNFYGGGSRGKVTGIIKSTLTGCTVTGSVYGAGYSADVPTVTVFNKEGFKTIPFYNSTTGVFEKGVFPDSKEYNWSNDFKPTEKTLDDSKTEIYVDIDVVNLTDLGTVTGKVELNIGAGTSVTKDVFGGGESSASTNDVEVNISGGTMRNVFGGGDNGLVGGDTKVTLSGSANITGNVYGGGNKAPVSGSATVNIQ